MGSGTDGCGVSHHLLPHGGVLVGVRTARRRPTAPLLGPPSLVPCEPIMLTGYISSTPVAEVGLHMALMALTLALLGAARVRVAPARPGGASFVKPVPVYERCAISAAPAPRCVWTRSVGCSCGRPSCGLFGCQCLRTPLVDRPPWEVLDLNISSALSSSAVLEAFEEKTRLLHPAKNTACLRQASAEFVAARRARDTLFSLANVAQRDEFDHIVISVDQDSGTETDVTYQQTTRPPQARRQKSKPFSRARRARDSQMRLQTTPILDGPHGIGEQNSILRIILDWFKDSVEYSRQPAHGKGPLTVSWWAWTRRHVRALVRTSMDALRSCLRRLIEYPYELTFIVTLILYHATSSLK